MDIDQRIEIERLLHEALFRAFDHGQASAFMVCGHYAPVVVAEAEAKRAEAAAALTNALDQLLPSDEP